MGTILRRHGTSAFTGTASRSEQLWRIHGEVKSKETTVPGHNSEGCFEPF